MDDVTKIKLEIDLKLENIKFPQYLLDITILSVDSDFQYSNNKPFFHSYYSRKNNFILRNYSTYEKNITDGTFTLPEQNSQNSKINGRFLSDKSRKDYLIKLYKTLLDWGKTFSYEKTVKIIVTDNIWELKLITDNAFIENYL